MALAIPVTLAATCRTDPERAAWLARLPDLVAEMQGRWSLTIGAPFDGPEVSCGWVAPATRADGTRAVLKLGMPHMEGAHEIHALRAWDGDPTVLLLDADEDRNAMLLERCEPGSILRELPEPGQDVVVAALLRRLWRAPVAPHPFRPLADMTAHWADETLDAEPRWLDPALVREGLRLFEQLARPAPDDVLLATDLHAGNVLRAQREPWLVIDPKPFVGDPAYDATQHLFNCERLLSRPHETIDGFAGLLELDVERVRLWTFSRAAAECPRVWNERTVALARAIAP